MRTFKKLPVLNIVRRPGRSAALMALTALLSFTVFGALVLTQSLGRGMASLERRLGADIMVVPEEAAGKSGLESIVLQGNPTYFYMDDTKLDEVRAVDGVGETTTQLYLASLAASCCSAKVQLMGFDPATDFTIEPWIRDSYSGELGEMEIVVGSGISSSEGDRLLFYDVPCTVAAKLTETGTNYDRCVFAGEDTIRELIKSSIGKQLNQFKGTDPQSVVSCILLKVKDGADIDEVVSGINGSVANVKAIRTASLVSGTAKSLSGISGIIRMAAAIVSAIAFIILAIAFSMQIHERKREFAILRVFGVSKGSLAKSIFAEIAMTCFLGGLAGAGIFACVMIPFSGAVQGWLNVPMLMPGAAAVTGYLGITLLLCIAAGALSSAWNVLRVSRSEISQGLREEK